MKGPKTGKSKINLEEALKAAAALVPTDEIGMYKVEIVLDVGNPRIHEYIATITPI